MIVIKHKTNNKNNSSCNYISLFLVKTELISLTSARKPKKCGGDACKNF